MHISKFACLTALVLSVSCRKVNNPFAHLEQLDDLSELGNSELHLLLKHPDIQAFLSDLPRIEKNLKIGIPSGEYRRRPEPITLDRIRRYHEDTGRKFSASMQLVAAKLLQEANINGMQLDNFNPNKNSVVKAHIRHSRDHSKAECLRKNKNRKKGTSKFKCESSLTERNIMSQYKKKGSKKFNPFMSQRKKVKGGTKSSGFKNSRRRTGTKRIKMKARKPVKRRG